MTQIPAIVTLGARDLQFWLDAANQAVRSYCGWHVAPVITETVRLDGDGRHTLLLPTGRLLRVDAVTNDGVDVLDLVDPSTKGMLEIRGRRWSDRLGGIVVTITHGHDQAPDLAGVIATAAARGATTGLNAGIAQQAVGPASVRYVDSIPLLQSEKDILDPYRITWGA